MAGENGSQDSRQIAGQPRAATSASGDPGSSPLQQQGDPVAAPASLVSRLRADQYERWYRGERVLVEAYLKQYPGLESETEAILDLIYHEFCLREQGKEQPCVDEYVSRFPRLASQVRKQLEVHSAFRTDALGGVTTVAGEDGSRESSAGGARGWPQIAGYEILSELGRGGMGVVYQAQQARPRRLVALKMIRSADLASAQELARFRVEADAVARLQHPHVVQIYEVGEQGGRPYLVLEYVGGGNLARKLDGTPWASRPAAQLVQTLARAVHAAHQARVIHRDLKPANVLLTPEGMPKISDFGLAKQLDREGEQTQTGAVLGTPSYMAPEQAAGRIKEIGAATDVYALGAILYELLTGRLPFRAESSEATRQLVLSHQPVPPRRLQPRVPRDLETICLKCLDKEPGRRFPSAEALAEDLQRYLDGKPIRSRPIGPAGRLWRWTRRNPKVTLTGTFATATAMAAAIGFASLMLYRSHTLKQAQLKAAEQALDQGLALCEKGEVSQGMLWLARGLELAPANAEDLNRVIRLNLAAWGRQLSPLQAIFPHPTEITAVAFSADGKRIATGCRHGTATVWDTATGKQLLRIPINTHAIRAVAFSPDGTTILTASQDSSARLWDAGTGKAIAQFEHRDESSSEPFQVYALTFSPDGKTVLTGCGKGSDFGCAQLWNALESRPTIRLVHQKPVWCIAFSPDARMVVTGSPDQTAKLWDARTGELLNTLRHRSEVKGVAFSPDGKVVLTGTLHGTLHTWNASTGVETGTALSRRDRLSTFAFSPNARAVLTASEAGSAELWEEELGYSIGSPLRHAGNIYAASFSPDGQSILTGSGDHSARLWKVISAKSYCLTLPHEDWVPAVAFSPDDAMVLTGSWDMTARLWDATTGGQIAKFEHQGQVVSVAFSPDGNTIGTGTVQLGKPCGYAQLWSVHTRSPIGQPLVHQEMVATVAFSPAGRIMTAGGDGIAQFWDAETGRRLGSPLRHNAAITSAALSPRGEWLLTGTSDGTAHLWDSLKGERVCPALEHEGAVRTVAFSPDGEKVLTGAEDHQARLWTNTGIPIGRPLQHDGEVRAVAFSPDGSFALTGSTDHLARLWDTRTGELAGNAIQHQGAVGAVAFSPCGKYILTGSEDRSARLWDAATGRPIGPSFGLDGQVRALAFSKDGKKLVIAGYYEKGRLWKLAPSTEDTIEHILCWTKVITGMDLDNEGRMRLLDHQSWNNWRHQMLGENGSPSP